MAEYEFALLQVYSLTNTSNNTAKPEQYNSALGLAQTARDTIAGMPTPYCAQKLQSATLSSMDHLMGAIKIKVGGGSQTQFQTEIMQAQAEQKTVEAEFGTLSAKAGLEGASPTP